MVFSQKPEPIDEGNMPQSYIAESSEELKNQIRTKWRDTILWINLLFTRTMTCRVRH
jgi:hypothetical protein